MGATVEEIQAINERPIKPRTIVAYIAEAAATSLHGGWVDFARLSEEAGLTYPMAAALCKGKHQLWGPALVAAHVSCCRVVPSSR